MKKFIIHVVLVVFLLVFMQEVSALSVSNQFTKSFIGNYHYVFSNGKYGDFEHIKRVGDDMIAYCIEPGVSFSQESYEGYYDLSLEQFAEKVQISKEQVEKISLIASYGWGYQNHYGNEWIVATQSLIWQELGRDFQFTSRNKKENPWEYVIDTPKEIEEKMAEIQTLVNTYRANPLFNTTHAKVSLNRSYRFVDSTSQVSSYAIKNCENCTATIDGNSVEVRPIENQNGKVVLEKNNNTWNSMYVIYYQNAAQNLIVPGKVPEKNISLTYEIVKGSVQLTKYDADTKYCSPKAKGGSLKGSIYKLYKEDNTFVTDLVIDSNCQASFGELELGKYYIKEYQPGNSYQLDTTKYSFEVTADAPHYALTVYDKMDLGQISINKFDSKTNSCQSTGIGATLKGAVYGIYYRKDSLNSILVQKITVDENCSALSKRNLAIGNYYLIELEAPVGYLLDKTRHEFSITKENVDGVLNLTVQDEIIGSNIHIHKSFLSEMGNVPEKNASFAIFYADTNIKYKTITTDASGDATVWLPFGKYILKQTSGIAGYHFIEDQVIVVNEESDQDLFLSYTNEPYKAKVKLIKEDTTGNPIKMKGIRFKIYDVIQKKFVCQTNEDCEFITNEQGEFITNKELFPSTYRIIELDQKIPGYLWNQEGIEFTIDENSSFLEDGKGHNILVIHFANQPVLGKIKIVKYGEKVVFHHNKIEYEKIPLGNILFGLYQNGQLLEKGRTDEAGCLIFDHLALGNYTIVELENDGIHRLNALPYQVLLEYKDQYTEEVESLLEVYNELPKGSFYLKKVDDQTKSPIPQVTFAVYTEDHQLIFLGNTNEEGEIYLPDLPLGKYYLVEIKPADGYQKLEEKHFFEIKTDQEMIELQLENKQMEPIVNEVPDTYQHRNYFLIGIGLFMALLTAFYVQKN